MPVKYESLATSGLSKRDVYRLLTGIVVPRPIAWITTRNKDGGVNLAPVSAYVILANEPPMIGVSIGRRGAELKDTARNIRRTGNFVVNSPNVSRAEFVHRSSEELPHDVSEVEALGFSTIPSDTVDAPRLDGVSISMKCEHVKSIEFGRAKTELIIGEVKVIHVKEGLLDNGKIDTAALELLGRGGPPPVRRHRIGDHLPWLAAHPLHRARGGPAGRGRLLGARGSWSRSTPTGHFRH